MTTHLPKINPGVSLFPSAFDPGKLRAPVGPDAQTDCSTRRRAHCGVGQVRLFRNMPCCHGDGSQQAYSGIAEYLLHVFVSINHDNSCSLCVCVSGTFWIWTASRKQALKEKWRAWLWKLGLSRGARSRATALMLFSLSRSNGAKFQQHARCPSSTKIIWSHTIFISHLEHVHLHEQHSHIVSFGPRYFCLTFSWIKDHKHLQVACPAARQSLLYKARSIKKMYNSSGLPRDSHFCWFIFFAQIFCLHCATFHIPNSKSAKCWTLQLPLNLLQCSSLPASSYFPLSMDFFAAWTQETNHIDD